MSAFRQTYGSPLVKGKNRSAQPASQSSTLALVVSALASSDGQSSPGGSYSSAHLRKRNDELEVTSRVLAAKNHAIAKKLSTVETTLYDAKRVIRNLRKELSVLKHSSAATSTLTQQGSEPGKQVRTETTTQLSLQPNSSDQGTASTAPPSKVPTTAPPQAPTTARLSSSPGALVPANKMAPSPPAAPAPSSIGPRISRILKPPKTPATSFQATTAPSDSDASSQASPDWLRSRLSKYVAKDDGSDGEAPLVSSSVISPVVPALMSPQGHFPSAMSGDAILPVSRSPRSTMPPPALHSRAPLAVLDSDGTGTVGGSSSRGVTLDIRQTPKQSPRLACAVLAPIERPALAERRGGHANLLHRLPPSDIADLKVRRQLPFSEQSESTHCLED